MNDLISQVLDSPLVGASATALAVGITCLWLAAAWWTYLDMSRRTDSELARLGAAAWILLSTPAMLPLSLPVYALARPQQTVAQRRSGRMVEALTEVAVGFPTCPGCGAYAQEEWRRCPSCAIWLETDCPGCGQWSAVDLAVCPFCATERAAMGELGVLIGVPAGSPEPGLAPDVLPEGVEPERRREPARRLARLG